MQRVFIATVVLSACSAGGGPGWIQDDVETEPPRALRDLGLYADVATREPLDGFVAYTPASQLWSSGTDKERLLWLPEGTSIGTSEPGWDFPVGTVLAKTFLFDEAPLETRLLFRRTAGWEYAEYVWRGQGARLLEGNWEGEIIGLDDADGAFDYTVPSRLDCRSCHENPESQTGTPVLGIGEHQITAELLDAATFDPAPPVAVVEGRFPEETEALRYFVANCTHCHDGGFGENSSFSLRPDDAVAETVGVLDESGVAPIVAPGDPEGSTLFQVFSGEVADAEDEMPPLGIDRRDAEGKAILRAWIEALP